MATNGDLLPPNQQKALIAILEYPSVAAAAKAAGVGHRTLSRWMAEDEAFRQTLAETQKYLLDLTISRISGAAPLAADVLAQIAIDESVPASVRVQAASRILSEQRAGMSLGALKNELDELRRIVDELEKRN